MPGKNRDEQPFTNWLFSWLVDCGLSTISSGPSANWNSHATPSRRGAAMPPATSGNEIRMAETIGLPSDWIAPLSLTLVGS